tara:strand:+ start:59 stop:382 length:324 start_codon:yes stop_codon:yes gene_type:complete
MPAFYNIKGASVSGGKETTELIAPNTSDTYRSIMFTNVHDTADATVTLFMQDDPISGTTSTYNIVHTVAIPADSSLVLDDNIILNFPDQYGLYITVAASDTVDVILS